MPRKEKKHSENRLLSHKNSNICLAIALLLLTMLFSSCATIISGTSAKIQINGAVDEPVNIVTSKNVYRDISLPTSVEVKRRSLEGQHIQISSENYAFSDIVLRKSNNPWSILSAALYGVPLLVDLMTNAASEPAQDHFFITPDAPRSQADSLYRADSLRWAEAEREVLRQIQARQLPEHYKRHEIRGSLGFGECQASHDRDKLINGFKEHYGVEEAYETEDLVGDAYLQAGLEYHFRLSRKWEIGMLANWGVSGESYSQDYDSNGNIYNPPLTGNNMPSQFADANESCRFFTFAPSVRYTWYETIGFRSYSRIAIGAMRHHLIFDYKRFPWVEGSEARRNIIETQTPLFADGSNKIKWSMAYQLTAIGASIGDNYFHFFGELGYGSLGIVRLGIGFMF